MTLFRPDEDLNYVADYEMTFPELVKFIRLKSDPGRYGSRYARGKYYYNDQYYLITVSDNFEVVGEYNVIEEFTVFYMGENTFKVIEGYIEDLKMILYTSLGDSSAVVFSVNNYKVTVKGIVSEDLLYKINYYINCGYERDTWDIYYEIFTAVSMYNMALPKDVLRDIALFEIGKMMKGKKFYIRFDYDLIETYSDNDNVYISRIYPDAYKKTELVKHITIIPKSFKILDKFDKIDEFEKVCTRMPCKDLEVYEEYFGV